VAAGETWPTENPKFEYRNPKQTTHLNYQIHKGKNESEVASKSQITSKIKARVDEKAERTQ